MTIRSSSVGGDLDAVRRHIGEIDRMRVPFERRYSGRDLLPIHEQLAGFYDAIMFNLALLVVNRLASICFL
jgi:hypothetical protein